jgi:cytochrome c5
MQARRQALAVAGGLIVALAATGPAAARQSGEQVYKSACMECHATGVDKAPKFGDRKEWASRIREGQALLTAEGWLGVRKMPARGGKPELTLAEFADAVAFMARSAGADWKDPDEKMLARIAAQEKKILDRRKAKKS